MTATIPNPDPPAEGTMRMLLVGDVVGKPGMRIACDAAAWFRKVLRANCLVVNAENAADGSGLRGKDYRRLMDAGYDAVTLGDHVFRRWEIVNSMADGKIARPCNLADTAAGCTRIEVSVEVPGVESPVVVGIVTAMGRVFMKPCDCPFRAVDRELAAFNKSTMIRLVDFHAEATSDAQLMGRYLDGRVSAVLGTHTHVATADEQIFPGGTAFQCDVGMTGPFESILGRKIQAVMEATLDATPTPFQVATGDVRLNATFVDVEIATGKATHIQRVELREPQLAAFVAAEAKRKPLL